MSANAAAQGQPVEIIRVDGHRVACDGGGGPLGHPKVFYEMGADGQVECLYCGRVYVQAGGPADMRAA